MWTRLGVAGGRISWITGSFSIRFRISAGGILSLIKDSSPKSVTRQSSEQNIDVVNAVQRSKQQKSSADNANRLFLLGH
jgi:hypothetical protein